MHATGTTVSLRRCAPAPVEGVGAVRRLGEPPESSRGTTRPAERGSALLATLLMTSLAVAGIVFSSLTQGLARTSRAVRSLERERAMAIAESGIDSIQVLLNAGAWTETSVLDWSSDNVDNDDDGLIDEADETLLATAELWRSDAIDNDDDGEVDEADEGVARVTATATVGGAIYQVTGWLLRTDHLLPDPPGTVHVNDPNGQIQFNGNAFEIDGNDRNVDGSPGPAPARYGVSVNGDPAAVQAGLQGIQLDNILGAGGIPSLVEWNPYDPAFIENLVEAFTPIATNAFHDHKGTYTGDLGNWDEGRYEVTVSHGDLEIGGGGEGAGILIVDGNLKLKGGWSYRGFVFVTGTVVLSGTGKPKKILGALFLGGDISNPQDLTVNGAATVTFSSEVFQTLREELALYRRAAIVEG